jgi:hypothetical protein
MRCPRCSATIGPEQDWCMECGAPARTRLAPTPNWQLPTVALGALMLIAGALFAFAFVKLTGDDDAPVSQTTPALTAPVPVVPVTGTSGPTGTTGPTASTGPNGSTTTPTTTNTNPTTTSTTPRGSRTTTTPTPPSVRTPSTTQTFTTPQPNTTTTEDDNKKADAKP